MFVRPSIIALAFAFALVGEHGRDVLAQAATKQPDPTADLNAATLPLIIPPTVPGGRQEIPLPDIVVDIEAGGGGRYLALRFQALNKIGIFDVNQLKIVGFIPITEDDAEFAAGARKMIVVSVDGVITRWDLATQKRELTQKIDLGGPAKCALLGSASAGPAIVSGAGHGHNRAAWLIDMETLKGQQFTATVNTWGFDGDTDARISSNGSVAGVWDSRIHSGFQSYVNAGDEWQGYDEHGLVGVIIPSPDGERLYTGRGIFTNRLQRVGEIPPRDSVVYSIPAVHGPYFVTVDGSGSQNRPTSAEKVYLGIEGDERPLLEIPNLDPVFAPVAEGVIASQARTLDKRLFLIPGANVIVQLATTKQKLVVVHFDVEQALKSSEVDYLIVQSRPPRQVRTGEQFKYQLEVKSRQGDVKYSLETSPPGMTISPTGLLSWSTTLQSPIETDVIVSIADDSQHQVFQSFKLKVIGADGTGSPVWATAASAAGSPLKPIATTPASLPAETTEVELPGTVRDVAVGGNGRLLLLHIPILKQIAILDLSQGKIAGYLPACDTEIEVVAGSTRALVFNLTQGVVSRYRLDTFEREVSVAIPFPDRIQFAGMGAGSDGPVMLSTFKGTKANEFCSFHFMDVDTMKPMAVSWPGSRLPAVLHRDNGDISVSTNGEVFVVSGLRVVRLKGVTAHIPSRRSNHGGFPSADGRFFLANGWLLNLDSQPVGDAVFTAAVPSVTGNYFIGLEHTNANRTRSSSLKRDAKLYMFGSDRPLATIPGLDVAPNQSLDGVTHVGAYGEVRRKRQQQRLFFVPDAHVIARLLPSNDRVELRRFNVKDVVERSGVDDLVVASQVPRHAEVGKEEEEEEQARQTAAASEATLSPTGTGDRQEVPLPGTVDDIDVGGRGRYLALQFRALHKIAIFDVNQLKIIGYIPARDADTRFAAGADKVIVVSGDSGVVSRWDLATQRREATQVLELGGPARHALLGPDSEGPAIVSGDGETASLVDMNTLRTSRFAAAGTSEKGFGRHERARISSSGRVIGVWGSRYSPSGLQSYVQSGDKWQGYYMHDSVGAIVPSPDGRLLYTAQGLFTSQLRRVSDPPPKNNTLFSVPAVHGPYFVTIDASGVAYYREPAERVYLQLEGHHQPLVDIPNLDTFFQPARGGRVAPRAWTLDKELFLIPDANIIVQLSSSKQKLIAVPVDVERALESADFDYLFVSSRPPRSVKAGERFEYQLEVKSKQGEVKYSLASGPPGMTMSPTGLLSWSTTPTSAAESSVIVAIADASHQPTFQTFELEVVGGDATAAGRSMPTAAGGPLKPIVATPASLAAETTQVKLPGMVGDVAVGGNGRLILFHLPDLEMIAILDVSQGKIMGYLPASGETKIVAGATRALVFSLTQRVFTRYRLDTLAREVTAAIPFPDPIQFVGMGAGSEGPVLLRSSRGTAGRADCSFRFLDIDTMKELAVSWPADRPPRAMNHDNNSIAVSTSGKVFVIAEIGVFRLSGNSVLRVGDRLEGGGLPSADGRFVLPTGGGLLKTDLQSTSNLGGTPGVSIPSVTGGYFISLGKAEVPARKPRPAKLYMFGESRSLVTIPNLEVDPQVHRRPGIRLPAQKRLFFVPEAEVIAALLPSHDGIELHRFDVNAALQASGVDYLLVTSHAPADAEAGKLYEYLMQVKSKRGGVKFSLDVAPAGMTVSEQGGITWTPPQDVKEGSHKVIVSVSDASGQSIFHTFSVELPAATKKLATQRERIPQPGARRKIAGESQKAGKTDSAARNAAKTRGGGVTPDATVDNTAFRAATRTWTDSTGKHKVVARFLEIVDMKTLRLALPNGQTRSIPLSRLSGEDLYEAVKSDLLQQGVILLDDQDKSPFKVEE